MGVAYQVVELIQLDQIKVATFNVRTMGIDTGLDDLATSIKAIGLLQPITTYQDSTDKKYVILAGQRRYNAHQQLNKQNPNMGFDKIKCIIVDEPKTVAEKMSLSLAENITQVQMHRADLVRAVTDLYNEYRDYDIVKEKFGISKYMIDKYVKLARLPEQLKQAINKGDIHPNDKKAENAALRAVDALQWTKSSDIPENDVLELAVEYAKGQVEGHALDSEAKKGGPIKDMIQKAKKGAKTKHTIALSTEVAEKLKEVAKANAESESNRATHYVVVGVTKDYLELEY